MYDLRTVRGSTIRAKLVLSEELKREHHLVNSALELLPKPQAEIYTAVRSLRELTRSMRNRERPTELGAKLRSMVPAAKYILGTGTRLAINQRRIPPSVDAGWSDLPNNDRRFESLEAIQQIELTPHRDNRVRLTDSVDEFGQRRACVDWRMTELDVQSSRRSQELFAEEFERSGVGTLELPDPADAPVILSPVGIYHQVGTTRMHDDPTMGVVNRDCRVHSVSNLYIAGGATFPTGGYANCTLTIVALALRLADHLTAKISDERSSGSV
jgi:choline dehydrogenase-like flavoprotein